MLTGMLDRPGSPAGDHAKRAGIAPSIAAGHQQKLVAAGLAKSERSGRLRLYYLASSKVAEAIEALGVLAPVIPVRDRFGKAGPPMCCAKHGRATDWSHQTPTWLVLSVTPCFGRCSNVGGWKSR
jgi:hypothetical protein